MQASLGRRRYHDVLSINDGRGEQREARCSERAFGRDPSLRSGPAESRPHPARMPVMIELEPPPERRAWEQPPDGGWAHAWSGFGVGALRFILSAVAAASA